MHDQWERPGATGVESLDRQMLEHLGVTLHGICEQSNVALCIDEADKKDDSLHGGECDLLKMKQRHQTPRK